MHMMLTKAIALDWCAFVQCPETMCKNVVWKDGECCPKCADEMMAMCMLLFVVG